ncbi:MAG: hypothetical protein WC998_03385 [Candidatus Paceibacterota bacterium]|jgi:hypothetical protein
MSFQEKDVRYYKGKYPVEVLIKGKRKGKKGPVTWRVKALVEIPFKSWAIAGFEGFVAEGTCDVNDEFTTIPRLLWRKQR